MRPEKLTISAFGSFAEEVTIDFTRLGTQGLYLITGDTGSGKTTIFDAIIFALYGGASGEDRESAMFRSKYAKEDAKTFVDLLFSYRGRQYRVHRNPEYLRPKGRGVGMTTQKADAVLEYPDGRQPVTRSAEVTKAVEEIIGLSRSQFTQIAMLAQGEFRRLLMAGTKERERIFRDIFCTGNYRQLQDHIKSEFLQQSREYQRLKDRILQYMEGITCRRESPFFEEIENLKKQGQPMEEWNVLLEGMVKEDADELEQKAQEQELLDVQLTRLNEQIGVAVSMEEAADNLERIEKELVTLQAEYEKKREAAECAAKEAEVCERLAAEANRIQDKLPDYQRQSELVAQIAQMEEELTVTQKTQTREEKKREKQLHRIVELTQITEQYRDAGKERIQAETQLEKNKALLSEAKELGERLQKYQKLTGKVQKAKDAYQKAAQQCEAAADSLNRKEKLFYDAQAGILAQELKQGMPCPVCGSLEHPRLAVRLDMVPSKEELEQDKEERKRLEAEREKSSREAGRMSEQQQQEENQLRRDMQRLLGSVADNIPEAEAMLKRQEAVWSQEQVALQKQVEDLTNREMEYRNAEKKLPALQNKRGELEERIQEYREEQIRQTNDLQHQRENLVTLQKGLLYQDEQSARKQMTKLQEQKSALEQNVRQTTEAVARCESERKEKTGRKKTLEEQLSTGKRKELVSLQEEKQELEQRKTQIQSEIEELRLRYQNNKRAGEQIEREWKQMKETEKAYKLLKSLSDTANGSLAGKDKIMLETYVQMTFFDRVLNRANLRLLKMTDGQYELVRRKGASNQKSQSGLELEVRDHYNGSSRGVQTLSGGESFMASLSLALGLSDEIQMAAGGIRLDTLFVDEGFGSLDDETLTKAVQVLNGLTGGCRLVGIISHVSELKQRIDRQIVVRKTRTGGSTVRIEC
ncbi:MAG: SMC family ATPase [Lachnospiraceae bacterium]|nr:SMC family ATPase [Lachnospiraceae bacterium]